MELALQIKNVSKIYQLGTFGSGTLASDLNRFIAKIKGKEDPLLKVGANNDRTKAAVENEIVWALKDVNFNVNKGDVVGIIGRNGAGKSTLLKLISRITSPSQGQINIKGRLASLLEVGTGFHPELTGKENIYLNGAILGMKRKEIDDKLEEIIEFSGVRKYVDTPVKRYSSGMLVRLGFAVAAHLESEILIVDEVLAVGDFEFQEKCLGKMKDVSSSGRTILFVSHNMASVKSLCNTGLLLNKGSVEFQGAIDKVIEKYLEGAAKTSSDGTIPDNAATISKRKVRFKRINLVDSKGNVTSTVSYFSDLIFNIDLVSKEKIFNSFIDLRICTLDGIEVAHASEVYKTRNAEIKEGELKYEVRLKNFLQPAKYTVTLGAHELSGSTIEYVEHILDFTVLPVSLTQNNGYLFNFPMGITHAESEWKLI